MLGSPGLSAGEAATSPRERRMIGDGQIQPEQAQHTAGERLGLSQGTVEHQPHAQNQLDR